MAKRSRTFSRAAHSAAELLGLQVRQARIERKWSVTELAERAGVSRLTLRKVETGDPTVAIGIAFDVANLVGVSLFYEEPGRLGTEVTRRREVVRLLPQRIRERDEDVD